MSMFDPNLHAQAVLALKESIQALGEGEDTQLLLDMIEGETDFFEVVDRMLAERAEDVAMADALKAQVKALNDRKSRFEKRADVTKTLLEQALLIAGLDKVQRPAATLSLAKRPAKVLVETESDIPARFWDDGEPVLNGTRLKEELQAREEKFTALIEASAESLDLAVEEFAQAFPDTENLGAMAERVRAYQALPIPASVEDKTSPEAAVAMAQQQARNEALALLRRDYVGVAGAVLTQPGRGLNIRVA